MGDLFAWASADQIAPAARPDMTADDIVAALIGFPEVERAEIIWRAFPEVHLPAGMADRLLPTANLPPTREDTWRARKAISAILGDFVSDSGGRRDAMAWRFLIGLAKASELAREELADFCARPIPHLRAAGIDIPGTAGTTEQIEVVAA